MFSSFKETAARTEITFAKNGYVLFVSGHGHDNEWLNHTFVFANEIDFFAALAQLAEIPSC